MMRRVHLGDRDLKLAEEACRALANRYRRDAEKHRNPAICGPMIESAAEFDRLAERLKTLS
jgi:hypothetical protein